ncbi:MAG TPA: ribosomal subunit interface protein, partial [Microbacteriaceae bacterium]|nr:ribosomal subunit interface protein [Microbacteriaceae bacterium]
MDVTLLANNVAIPDRFRDYVSEKSEKVHTLVDSAQTFHVKV